MCGFVGLVSKEGKPIQKEWLEKMSRAIKHRGPDGEGIKMIGNGGLGHRRLSVLDIASGNQPMTDHLEKAWIAYNGEIYNYKSIRKELENIGMKFQTRSDTEVLINFISTYEATELHRLNGMFGFAYYRPYDNYCLLARDHLGIKPVYYWEGKEWLAFASEAKALLTLPWMKFEIEESLLEELLTFRFVAGENTLFKSIKQLEPGQFLEFKGGNVSKKKFWELPFAEPRKAETMEKALEIFEGMLSKSVEMQLAADVEVGTFLSGGVDSGVITALSSIQKGKEGLKTFTVGFDHPEWDEREYAAFTSGRYSTDHCELIMTPDMIKNNIKKISFYNDEPVSHPNTIPLYFLCKMAKRKVKVILTGEGADEMLSGYPRHQIIRARGLLKNTPGFINKTLSGLFVRHGSRKIKMLGEGLAFKEDMEALIFNSKFVDNNEVNQLLKNDIYREGLTYRQRYAEFFRSKNIHHRVMALEVKTYLLSALHRLDRMSMANGLECRVPFLDYKIVEWVTGLNPNLKVKGLDGKIILKKMAEKYIDQRVIYRPKSGFGLPLADWFRDKVALKPFLDEMSSDKYEYRRFFDMKIIRKMARDHLSCYNDNSELFWILYCFQSWHEAFSDNTILD